MSNTIYPPINYVALKDYLPGLITTNPRTGNPQIQETSNDVSCVMERMGGVQNAASRLGVEEIEIEHWIDDHYIPDRYAQQIEKLTHWSVWSMQVPGFMCSEVATPYYPVKN